MMPGGRGVARFIGSASFLALLSVSTAAAAHAPPQATGIFFEADAGETGREWVRTNRGLILSKDTKLGIKGTGHSSMLQVPGTDDWYIAYHRWEGQIGDGPYHGDRRVAIQKIEYRDDGVILPIKMK